MLAHIVCGTRLLPMSKPQQNAQHYFTQEHQINAGVDSAAAPVVADS